MRLRASIALLVCLSLAVAALLGLLWNSQPWRSPRPRVRPSPLLARTFMEILCRQPSDAETVFWDNRPFDRAMLVDALTPREEAVAVVLGELPPVWRDTLRGGLPLGGGGGCDGARAAQTLARP